MAIYHRNGRDDGVADGMLVEATLPRRDTGTTTSMPFTTRRRSPGANKRKPRRKPRLKPAGRNGKPGWPRRKPTPCSGATTETTSNPYEDVLADTYESAYARRLRGFESPTYRMPSSYYDFRYGSSFHYVSAYDPAFYNVMVMGDQVWSSPNTSPPCSARGAARRSTWTRGTTAGTGVPISSWGFSFGSWGWGFGPWYDPWYYPGWGHGWGWGHPHWGPPHWGGHPHRPYASNIVHRANPNTPPSSGSRYYNRDQRFGTYRTSGTPNRGSSNGHFGVRNPSSGNQNARPGTTTNRGNNRGSYSNPSYRNNSGGQHLQPRRLDEQQFRGARTTAAATTRARRTTRAATTGAAARAAHTTAAAGAEARATQADAKTDKTPKAMKRTRWIIWAAILAVGTATAQTSYNRDMGGLLIDRDVMTPADLLGLSQTQFNFGTARAMAMAGAFTSLGADASSMAINPAGLGMYRKNEVTFTPMMTFARSTTPDAGCLRQQQNQPLFGLELKRGHQHGEPHPRADRAEHRIRLQPHC